MNIPALLFISILLSYNLKEIRQHHEKIMTIQSEQEMTYKLYVQFKDKKDLKEGDEVKLSGEIIGNIIGFDQNPDAYIVNLSIKNGIEIPLLSRFKIEKNTDGSSFIEVEPSDDKRIMRNNEYFPGVE